MGGPETEKGAITFDLSITNAKRDGRGRGEGEGAPQRLLRALLEGGGGWWTLLYGGDDDVEEAGLALLDGANELGGDVDEVVLGEVAGREDVDDEGGGAALGRDVGSQRNVHDPSRLLLLHKAKYGWVWFD